MRAILLLGTQMRMGGAQRILLTLGRWFHDQGYQVKTIFFYDKDGLHEKWQADVPFPIINLHGWSNESSPANFFRLLGGLYRLYRIIQCGKFEAILSFTHHANLLGIPVAWLGGIPRRVASHRGRIYGFPRWMEWLHAQMINLGMAQCLVALSESVRQDAIHEGVQPARVIVIHNGVRIPRIENFSRAKIRKELQVTDETILLLSTGRLAPEKGHAILLQAIPYVQKNFKRIVLVIAGDGPLHLKLVEMSHKLGIESSVRFLGLRQDVLELAYAADLFIAPSISEGLGQAILESMSIGTPVLATNVGGVPEIITDGVTGRLVPSMDTQALASAICELVSNEKERRRLGQAGKQTIMQHYSLEKMCLKYTRLLLGDHVPDDNPTERTQNT